MRSALAAVVCVAAVAAVAPAARAWKEEHADDDVAEVARRVAALDASSAGGPPACEATVAVAKALAPNGTWPDIRYKPVPGVDTRSHWPPSTHLNRTEQLATCLYAGTACCSQPAAVGAVARAAESALRWWLDVSPTNPDNWYNQYISTPLSLGRACLALNFSAADGEGTHGGDGGGGGGGGAAEAAGDAIAVGRRDPRTSFNGAPVPLPLLKRCAASIGSVPINVNPPGIDNITGGNAIWISSTRVYAGLLERNATAVEQALGGIWLQLATTVGVQAGVKQDLSFLQHCSPVTFGGVPLAHHAQLYPGGYGRGFTEYLLQWVSVTGGTGGRFAIPDVWAAALARFVLDGQATTIVGTTAPHFDVSAIGREVTRPGHRASWPPSLFASLPKTLPRWGELQALSRFLQGGEPSPPPGFRPPLLHHFHKADYVVLRRPSFAVTVKVTSNRSMNTECIAEENRRGRHLGQGTVFVYKRGDEHHDLAPVIDWKGLGGTTVLGDSDVACGEHAGGAHTWPPTNASCWADCYQAEWTGTTPFAGALIDPSGGASSEDTVGAAVGAPDASASTTVSAAPAAPAAFAVTAFAHVDTDRRGNATSNRSPQRRLRYRQSVLLAGDWLVTCTAGITEVATGQQADTTVVVGGGSDGSVLSPLPLWTNLEQRLLRGPVVTADGALGPGTHTLPIPQEGGSTGGFGGSGANGAGRGAAATQPAWVWHDGTAHVVLETDASSLVVRRTDNATGDWSDVGVESGPVSKGVFAARVAYAPSTPPRRGGSAASKSKGSKSHCSLTVPDVAVGAFDPSEWASVGRSAVVANTEQQQVFQFSLASGGRVATGSGSDNGIGPSSKHPSNRRPIRSSFGGHGNGSVPPPADTRSRVPTADRVLAAVVYDAASPVEAAPWNLTVDAPCVVALRWRPLHLAAKAPTGARADSGSNGNGGSDSGSKLGRAAAAGGGTSAPTKALVNITAADPTQSLRAVRLSVRGARLTAVPGGEPCGSWDPVARATVVTVALPGGEWAGTAAAWLECAANFDADAGRGEPPSVMVHGQ